MFPSMKKPYVSNSYCSITQAAAAATAPAAALAHARYLEALPRVGVWVL